MNRVAEGTLLFDACGHVLASHYLCKRLRQGTYSLLFYIMIDILIHAYHPDELHRDRWPAISLDSVYVLTTKHMTFTAIGTWQEEARLHLEVGAWDAKCRAMAIHKGWVATCHRRLIA